MPYLLLLLLLATPLTHALDCSGLQGTGGSGYALRQGDTRCEGFYRSNVGAPSLQLVNLTFGKPNFAVANQDALTLAASVHAPFTLRAMGIPLKLYYRLDAEVAAGKTFHWPLAILQRENVPARQVGIFGELGDKLYLPLRINGSEPPVYLGLRASIDVGSVQWRMTDRVKGACGDWPEWRKLPDKRFRAGRRMDLELPETGAEQVCVEVAALPIRGGDWLTQLLRVRLR